jgi:hypothetical protein
MFLIDHIKISTYAVNGSQFIVLCKSGTLKVDKCRKEERRRANELWKEMFVQAEGSNIYVTKYPSKFPPFLEAEFEKI